MIFLKILGKTGIYNFYSDNKSFYVTHTNKERIRTLKKDEICRLMDNIFSSEMRYSHDENGYQIYLDAANNKRYFKNGKEDLIKFLYNNGTTSICFSIENDNQNDQNNNTGKKYLLNTKKGIFTMLAIVIGTVSLFKGDLILNEQNEIFNLSNSMQAEEAIDIIETTSTIPEDTKQYFQNELFFNDILKYVDESFAEELRNIRFEDFGILYFTEEELNDPEKKDLAGYYSDTENPNKIHLRDQSPEIFNFAGAHEFVHLCQYPTKYIYIRETCAEIISHEYFNRSKKYAYHPAILNLSLLIEVIGPEPILKCCFAADDEALENAISEYLSKEDAEALLKEFKIHAKEGNHDKIKEYIQKMIEKKRELHPELEYLYYKLDGNERSDCSYFFNQHYDDYTKPITVNKSYFVEDEVFDRSNIKNLSYMTVKDIEDGNLDTLKQLYENGKTKDYEFIGIQYENENGIYPDIDITYSQTKDGFRFAEIPETYEEFNQLFLKNGLKIIKIQLGKSETLENKDDIDKELDNFGHDNHKGYIARKPNGKSLDYYRLYKNDGVIKCKYESFIEITIPPIIDLFYDQFSYKSRKKTK